MPTDAFLRQRSLAGFGEEGQSRLGSARVALVGVGGLGCPAALAIVAAGIGTLTLIDSDVVSASNLHRQTLYGPSDVGKHKAVAAKAALERVATVTTVEAHVARLGDDGARLLAGHDVVVDCTDTWASRRAVSDAAIVAGLPVVWGAVSGWFGQVTVLPAGKPIADLFPGEPELDLDVCEGGGVFGPLCAQVGAAMASAAVLIAAGLQAPLNGRLTVLDARDGEWRTLRVASEPQ